jgi:hypothetical protein
MLRAVIFALLVVASRGRSGARPFSGGLLTNGLISGNGAAPPGVDCSDGVCKLPDNPKAKVLDLESKMREQSQATGAPTKPSSLDAKEPTEIASAATDAAPTPTAAAAPAAASTVEDSEDNSKVAELEKMGWKRVEASRALKASNNDVSAAAALLETEQEEDEKLQQQAKELNTAGWSIEAAKAAIKQCEGNVSAAAIVLAKEEEAMVTQFEGAVKDMVNSEHTNIPACCTASYNSHS